MTDAEKLPKLPSLAIMGPYKVPIILVTPAGLARKLKSKVGEAAGFWNPMSGRIYIDKTLSLSRQWDVYWHEFDHALNDLRAIFRGGL